MKFIDPKLLREIRGSFTKLITLGLLAGIRTVLLLAQSFLIAWIIVRTFQDNFSNRKTLAAVIAFIVIFLARAFLNRSIVTKATSFGSTVRKEIQEKLLKSRLEQGWRDESEAEFNNFVSLISTGLTTLDSYFSQYLPSLINSIFSPAAAFLVIAVIDWRSAVYALITIPLMPLFGILIGKFTDAAMNKKWESLFVLRNYFLDLITGMKTLQVFGRLSIQDHNVKTHSENFRKETMKVLRVSFLSSFALELVANLSVALIALMLGLRLVNGKITLLPALFILIIAPELYWPLRQSAALFHSSVDGVTTLNRAMSYLARGEDGKSEAQKTETINEITKIFWNKLTIKRGSNIIEIPAGEIIQGHLSLLATPSGSGKTTLTLALMGFLELQQGNIEIISNNKIISLNNLNSNQRHKLFSWLPQNPTFPNESIKQHFQRIAPAVKENEIIALLRELQLDPHRLKAGLNTMLGSSESNLSVGENRRIAIARAILHPAPILILDEPTASLDDETESVVNKIIANQVAAGRLVLMISHRIAPNLGLQK